MSIITSKWWVLPAKTRIKNTIFSWNWGNATLAVPDQCQTVLYVMNCEVTMIVGVIAVFGNSFTRDYPPLSLLARLNLRNWRAKDNPHITGEQHSNKQQPSSLFKRHTLPAPLINTDPIHGSGPTWTCWWWWWWTVWNGIENLIIRPGG